MKSLATTLAALSLLLIGLNQCKNKPNKAPEIDPGFSNYISAYTSGVIPKTSHITLRLASPIEGEVDPEKLLDEVLFEFEPEIEGTTRWVDKQTLEFIPNENLPSGKIINAEFHLSELLRVEDKFSDFQFQFQTIPQNLHAYVDGLHPYKKKDPTLQYLEVRLSTSDVVDTANIKRVLTAQQNGQYLSIKYIKSQHTTHHFQVENVLRKEAVSTLHLMWDGSPIGVDQLNKREIEIPALGDFKITNLRVNHAPEQYLELQFSDPLDTKQNLDGIITIDGVSELRYLVDNNTVTIYPPSRITGTRDVKVSRGLKNFLGFKMAVAEQRSVRFEELKPNVRLVGSGNILPSTNGLNMPFEAVNLNSVNVRVTRIFENNIVQFFQQNGIASTNRLNQVAQKVLEKTIELNPKNKGDLKNWNRYFLSLEDFIKVEPGAIYKIDLWYTRKNSAYACQEKKEEENEAMTSVHFEEEESWNEREWSHYYNRNNFNYYDDYQGEEQFEDPWSNPCSQNYYSGRYVSRNILTSDIGLIAKAGSDKNLHVFVNDLVTTDPMGDVVVEFYDYQSQLMASSRTDAKGMVEIHLKKKPFLIVAKSGVQRGYLKLRDGEALSLSNFSIEGNPVQKGIKGFIYGERGVWRPGDTIFLSFIMEDKEGILPKGHPVVLTVTDPRGKNILKETKTHAVNGFYDFRFATASDAPTGNYSASIRVGNRHFGKSLKVETVKPNRLKIYMDFDKKVISQLDGGSKGKLKVKWLHGAVAKNLKAKVDVTVNQISTRFSAFKGFHFDDPTRSFYADAETVFSDNVDEKGEATFDTELKVGEAAPGMLKAYFTTKVFEQGGNFSIDRHSVTYSPYTHYVGLKIPKGDLSRGTLVTDEDHKVEIGTVDADGKAVARKNLEIKVYKLNWRWWWDRYDHDLASYIARKSSERILDMTVSTNSKGQGYFNLRVDQPLYGRFLIRITDPESGHATGKIVYFDWPYWRRSKRPAAEFPTMLSFSADKENYDVGDPVKLTFPSSEGGRALVCVESGTKVLRKYWVETKKGETRFEFNTDASMAPNVFVHISLLQAHQTTANDLPIRLYGVVPIGVENPDSHLKPTIKMADVLRPETEVLVTVGETDGKPMTYTLAIVDEGLLDLTHFRTPNPWPHFYAREALGVKTWDLYDQVMGAYGAELDKILAVGGDGEASGKKSQKANRFKPMVRFIGPFHLDADKKKTHMVKIPNYIGSVRVMVVAGEEQRYGRTEKTVPVRKPLMVLATLPRVLGPGEIVKLPVNVFAMEKHVKNVTVEVIANEMFELQGEQKRKMTFSDIGDEVVNFELKVVEKLGLGKVKVRVRSGNESATDEIEIDVRAPNPEITDIYQTVIEPGKSWSKAFGLRGIDGSNNVTLELSSMPPVNMENRLRYLIRYPYGCIEQTTSSAFPQLFLTEVMELNNDQKMRINQHMEAALRRIYRFTHHSGGFSYWPGGGHPSDWGSSYAGHFMLEAEKLGYKLPSSMKAGWISYQKSTARNWDAPSNRKHYHYYDLPQAYRLYTLALANAPELGAMNRLREDPNLTEMARWRLAAAYALVGQPEVAKALIKDLTPHAEDYTELSYGYGSGSRDLAMILETLTLMEEKTLAATAAKELASRLSDDRYMNTQATSFSLVAMCRFMGSAKTEGPMSFSYNINNSLKGQEKTIDPIKTVKLDINKLSQSNDLKLSNTGDAILYARVIHTGIPLVGDQSSEASNVKLAVSYVDMDGNVIDPSKIEQGTDFIAQVEISNPGTRGYLYRMSLDQIFPSGWEIHNSRMDEFTSSVNSGAPNYQDIRDDRVYSFYHLNRYGKRTFRIQLNATYQGRFYLPTVKTEAMYDNAIRARVPGRWVEVVGPGE